MTTGPTTRLQPAMSFDDYIAAVRPHFSECGYEWQRAEPNNAIDIRWVAYIPIPGVIPLNFRQFVFVFTETTNPTAQLIQEFTDGCKDYSVYHHYKPRKWSSPPVRLVPVVVTPQLNPELRSSLLEALPQANAWYSISVVPAVYDLGTLELVYSTRRRALFIALWSAMHCEIAMLLQP